MASAPIPDRRLRLERRRLAQQLRGLFQREEDQEQEPRHGNESSLTIFIRLCDVRMR